MHTFFLHAEQNSSTHVGHLTATGITVDTVSCCTSDVLPAVSAAVEETEQTVSQPAFGHQVRVLSNSTSAKYNFRFKTKTRQGTINYGC